MTVKSRIFISLFISAWAIALPAHADRLSDIAQQCDRLLASAPVTPVSCRAEPEVSAALSWLENSFESLKSIAPGTGPDEVAPWLTLGDSTATALRRQPNLNIRKNAPRRPVPTLIVDPVTRFQEMEGYGASMTESSMINIYRLPPLQQQKLLKMFFSKTEGAGFDFVRVPLGASDFADGAKGSYTYDDVPAGATDLSLEHFSIKRDQRIIRTLKKSFEINPDLHIMLSPWTAPPWMKTNKAYNDGSLAPEFRQAYADYLVKSIEAYEQEGIPVFAISIQNEPLFATYRYPSMKMSIEEQKVFIRDFFGPALEKKGLKTKILVLDHNWTFAEDVSRMLDDPKAKKYIGGVAYHGYGGTSPQMLLSINKHPDIPTYQTEMSSNDPTPSRPQFKFKSWYNWWMKNQVIEPANMGVRSALAWNLALDQNNGPRNGGWKRVRGIITVNQKTYAMTPRPEYYAAAQVSKFIRRGSVRILSTQAPETGLANVAFQNKNGELVLLVQNRSKKEATFRVQTPDCRTFDYTLPAGAAVTFKWMGPSPT